MPYLFSRGGKGVKSSSPSLFPLPWKILKIPLRNPGARAAKGLTETSGLSKGPLARYVAANRPSPSPPVSHPPKQRNLADDLAHHVSGHNCALQVEFIVVDIDGAFGGDAEGRPVCPCFFDFDPSVLQSHSAREAGEWMPSFANSLLISSSFAC